MQYSRTLLGDMLESKCLKATDPENWWMEASKELRTRGNPALQSSLWFIIKQVEEAISDICIQKHINGRDAGWSGWILKIKLLFT